MKGREKYLVFEFKARRYELILADERWGPGVSRLGFLTLIVDGEIVLKTEYSRRFSDVYDCYITALGEPIETLLLGDWIDDFLKLVKAEKSASARLERKKESDRQQLQAEKLSNNFALGKFSSYKKNK